MQVNLIEGKPDTIEKYAATLIAGVASLKTLENQHILAYKAGILDEDESETAKSIQWEIRRLITLYNTQMKNVLDRTKITQEDIINEFKKLMPEQ